MTYEDRFKELGLFNLKKKEEGVIFTLVSVVRHWN